MTTRSKKPPVIEYIFDQLWDEESQSLARSDVTFEDVRDAIDATGAALSKNNPANFAKDIVRSANRNAFIPRSVLERGYTIEQSIGQRQVFRFVPIPEGQDTPFQVRNPPPEMVEYPHPLESISLSIAARRLGRRDESWLTQVSVRLNVLQTHLALHSSRNIASMDVLQMNVKLGPSEIDAVFLAHEPVGEREHTDILIACEMKQVGDELEWEQLERGAMNLRDVGRAQLNISDLEVIPMAVKIIRGSKLWVMEFSSDFPPLTLVSEAVYAFRPSVKGI